MMCEFVPELHVIYNSATQLHPVHVPVNFLFLRLILPLEARVMMVMKMFLHMD